jgi:hypothetical protein
MRPAKREAHRPAINRVTEPGFVGIVSSAL